MNKFFSKKGEFLVLINIILLISLITQLVIVPSLPTKYFYDSNNILSISNGMVNRYFDESYLFAGNFFKFINIFNFSTFTQWAVLLTIVGTILLILYVNRYTKIEIHKLIFFAAVVTFLNIYIFRISKDFIQWIFWLLLFLSILDQNKYRKNIIILVLFIIETIYFRSYYIAIYLGYLAIYTIINKMISNKKSFNYVKLTLILVFGIFIALLLIQKVSPSLYSRIINVRQTTNMNRIESVDAVTIIQDLFNSNNVINYMINFVLNFFRILFPIELIFKGMKYIPFIIFQFYLTINIINSIKNINKSRSLTLIMLISMFISYTLVSSIYEPDFGSMIRHEIACMPIFMAIIFNNNLKEKKNEKNKHYSTNL